MDATFLELFARQFSCVSVTDYTGDAVVADERCEIIDHLFGAERRLHFSDGVDNKALTITVTDGEGERVEHCHLMGL